MQVKVPGAATHTLDGAGPPVRAGRGTAALPKLPALLEKAEVSKFYFGVYSN